MRDAPAGTSFLQSLAEIDHRDRFHHHAPNHKKHEYLHRRQIDAVITSVTSTVSVIQDIIVDSNGSTIQIQTWLAASTTVEAPSDPTVSAPTALVDTTPSTTSAAGANPLSNTVLGPLNTEMISQSTSIQPTTSVPTSQPLPLTSAPFLGSNFSTSAGPQSSSSSSFLSLSSNHSNYTTSSSIISSSTKSTTSVSVSSEYSISSSSEPSSTESYDSSNTPTSTAAGGGAFGGVPGVTTSGSSTSTAVAGSSGGAGNAVTAPSTPAVVGGVVGGIAGIVFIVALLMVLVRWRKRKQSVLRLADSPSADARAISGGTGGPSQSVGMTEKSSPFAIPAALVNLTGYKRASQQPSMEASSTAGSERGFYRVSGRKLPSVFQHGGDGYGGGYQGGHDSLSGSSFYRDSRGFYGGPGSPTSPSAGRDSGVPITRPSPARTPVISEGAFGPPSPPPAAPLDPLRRPDALGRSHPSRDGSHGSRFTEEV